MFDGLGGKLLDESDRIKVDGYMVEQLKVIDYVLFWHYASIFVASNEQVEFDIANKNIKKKTRLS